MLDRITIDKRTTKQEVHSHIETNVETSGNIVKTIKNSRFICIGKTKQSFKTIFSSSPFYIEKEQVDDGRVESAYHKGIGNPYYKEITRKFFVNVLQVLAVGPDYTLEIEEISREEDSSGGSVKNIYYQTPTII